MIRYKRSRHAHVLYGKDAHLYLFLNARLKQRRDSGVTLKKRRHDRSWRHLTLRFTYQEKGVRWDGSRMVMLELVTHVSENHLGDRVRGTKRYLRFKSSF